MKNNTGLHHSLGRPIHVFLGVCVSIYKYYITLHRRVRLIITNE